MKAAVVTDKEDFPHIPDATAGFVYARLQRSAETLETGYSEAELEAWVKRARLWSAGRAPADLKLVGGAEKPPRGTREVFIYMINGFKPKAPAAAMALLSLLGRG